MSLSPDESRALVTNASGGLTVYHISSARVVACARDVNGLDARSPAMFVHGGRALLIGCKDGQAKLFDSASASRLQSLNHDGLFSAASGSATNQTLRWRRRLCTGGACIQIRGVFSVIN